MNYVETGDLGNGTAVLLLAAIPLAKSSVPTSVYTSRYDFRIG